MQLTPVTLLRRLVGASLPANNGALRCSNDDFLLHYGFVPAGNVHDDFVLFESIGDALQWHWASFPPKVHI